MCHGERVVTPTATWAVPPRGTFESETYPVALTGAPNGFATSRAAARSATPPTRMTANAHCKSLFFIGKRYSGETLTPALLHRAVRVVRQ
jgi:hypothetical protein